MLNYQRVLIRCGGFQSSWGYQILQSWPLGGTPKADRLGSARPCRGAHGQLWVLRFWGWINMKRPNHIFRCICIYIYIYVHIYIYEYIYIYICILHSMYILHTIGLFQVSIAKPSYSYWSFRSATEPRPLPWAFMECWKPWAAWAPQS